MGKELLKGVVLESRCPHPSLPREACLDREEWGMSSGTGGL